MRSTIVNGYGRRGSESIKICFCRGPHDLAIYAVKGKGYEVGTARQLAEWDVGFFFDDDLRSKGTAMVAESLVYSRLGLIPRSSASVNFITYTPHCIFNGSQICLSL